LSIIIFLMCTSLIAQDEWITYYEKSGFKATPDYEETVTYFKKLADASPWVEYTTFGISPQGRDLPLVIMDKNGNFSPGSVKRSGNAVLFVEAGIHPGEIEGKDAMMLLLRDIAIYKKDTSLLDHVSIVFIPIFSVDGHERSGPYNRINQNGPEEMGWRTTAQNLNLNRDFLKADAPEMQYWLKLFNEWLPDFFMDIHTTDGADYQYPLTYQMETNGNMDPGLTRWANETYIPQMKEDMENAGFPVFRYIAFRTWFDPTSGLRNGVAGPRYSQGYVALQNRPGLLVETHMLKPYKNRVESTYELVKITLDIMNKNYKKLKKLNREADKYAESEAFRNKIFALNYKGSDKDSIMVDFKGVEYEVLTSDLTGGDWFIYDSTKPKNYKLPYFYKMEVVDSVNLPLAYVIPPEWQEVITRLKMHGIKYYKLKQDAKIKVESIKFTNPSWRNSPYEGRFLMNNVDFEVSEKEIEYPKGSIVVPVGQRTSRVIAHIFEPKAEDSFVKWGFFNNIFGQKEYAETYVMEKEARKMLKENPELKNEFEQWKNDNPDLANNQWVQLNWFYARSPWWDEKMNVYPVGRIVDQEVVEGLRGKL
jgi:hypothetical protein